MLAFHALHTLFVERLRTAAMVLGLTVSLAAPTPGVAAPFDALLGTFGVVEQNRIIEIVRIERHGRGFLLYQKHAGRWLAPVTVEPVTKEQLETIIRQPIDVPFQGLGDDKLAVLTVPRGWRLGSFECDTGYWLATSLGPAELHKL
jgi:hypothetical protein